MESTVVIEKLGPISVFLALLLKVVRKDVVFFDMSGVFKNRYALWALKKLGIRWLSYYEFEDGVMFIEEERCVDIVEGEFDEIKRTKLYESMVGTLMLKNNGGKLDCAVQREMTNWYMVAAKTELFRRNLSRKSSLIRFRTVNLLTELLWKLLRRGESQESGESETDWPVEKETVYFPHKGIYYGSRFFRKDHYYSSYPFCRDNILHLSIGGIDGDTLQYYDRHRIPRANVYRLKESKRLFKLLRFLGLRGVLAGARKIGLLNTLILFRCYSQVLWWVEFFEGLPKTKICLIGYDYLFPREIPVACEVCCVKTFAVQERFVQSDRLTFYNFDDDGAQGETALSMLKRSGLNSVGEYFICGSPRCDIVVKDIGRKYRRIKKDRYHLVVAFDWYSSKTEIEDRFRPISNRKVIMKFYKALLTLARACPNCYIVIKGKETESYGLKYLEGVMEEIRFLPNIEIEMDIGKYNPYKLGSWADTVVALSSSIADELLACGKRVFIYDPVGYMEHRGMPYKEWGALVENREELVRKIRGGWWPKDVSAEYGIEKGKTVREQIRKKLSEVYDGNV